MSSPGSNELCSQLKHTDEKQINLNRVDAEKFVQLTRLYNTVKAVRKKRKAEQLCIKEERKRKLEDDLDFKDMIAYLSSSQFIDKDWVGNIDSVSVNTKLNVGVSECSVEEELEDEMDDVLHNINATVKSSNVFKKRKTEPSEIDIAVGNKAGETSLLRQTVLGEFGIARGSRAGEDSPSDSPGDGEFSIARGSRAGEDSPSDSPRDNKAGKKASSQSVFAQNVVPKGGKFDEYASTHQEAYPDGNVNFEICEVVGKENTKPKMYWAQYSNHGISRCVGCFECPQFGKGCHYRERPKICRRGGKKTDSYRGTKVRPPETKCAIHECDLEYRDCTASWKNHQTGGKMDSYSHW